MAFYDNKLWTLSHIYHSFTTGDDTGVSEIVLSSGNFKEDLRIMADTQGLPSFKDCISEDEDEDEDGVGGRSPDFRGGQTRILQPTAATKHSNKVEKQKTCDRPARTVVWKKGNVDSTEDLEQIFPRKQLDAHQEQGSDEVDGAQQAPKVSLLSHLIENMSVQDANPWLDYAKFDATGNLDLKITRKIRMFYPCTTSTEEDKGRGYPVDITCYRDIGVSDLLGLALFHYTQQRRQPAQLPPLENHCLCMCDEEDGLVDSDFPPLISSDPLAKYGFSVLALVPAAVQRQSSTSSSAAGDNASNAFCVTLHMPDGTFSQIEIQDKTMTLGELTSLGLERRKYLQKAKYKFNYHLEAPDVHGVALDPKQTLSSQDGNSEFYIVRDNSKRVSDLQSTGTLPNFLEADLYQSFNVEIFTKVRTKVDIHLGISGEKVEIDPRQQASSAKFWSRQKAVSYAMDKVVSCEILKKSKVVGSGSPAGDMNPRVVFRMVYLSDSGWGHKDFESDREVAEEVVQKLNYLLDQKQSTARDNRREYLQNKQKKRERIRTLTN
eukprot:TRINITY_DN3258_c0_g1_i2.p1 TRINITY_DN3258_c0_g1~~TRINITY_DN3258_c0_g1_i2.p1  ORF type:complete len:548 (+),score=138.78 TRINITY_DN3258_c0_g1_i2:651-2294(+)